eukprot:XP_019920892.1 PREDICTED: uncharacterized protein LOC105323606 [Crassostrea gigas]
MRGFQCLILCVLLYSASVDAFGTCADANDVDSCPENATCEDENADSTFECECEDGFDEVDVPIGGTAVTFCDELTTTTTTTATTTTTTTTTMPTTTTTGTTKRSVLIPLIGGGALLLALLAGGAAAVASSSG